MCKLSLWLVSLDPKLPFSFVDDKVLHGNSCSASPTSGSSKHLHIDPDAASAGPALRCCSATRWSNVSTCAAVLGAGREPAPTPRHRGRRRRPAALRHHQATASGASTRRSPRSSRDVADGVIAAGLRLGGKPGKALNEAYENLPHRRRAGAIPARSRSGGPSDARRHPRRRADADGRDGLRALEAAALGPRRARRHGAGRLRRSHRQPAVPGRQEAHRRRWAPTSATGSSTCSRAAHEGSADLVAYFFLRATSAAVGHGHAWV